MDFQDRFAIHELLSLYGHLVDKQAWERFDELFVPEGTFDATSVDGNVDSNVQEIITHFSTGFHPPAHYMTNVYVFEEGGMVKVWSKGLFPRENGFTGAFYDDVVVKVDGRWLFQSRTIHRVWRMTTDSVLEILTVA